MKPFVLVTSIIGLTAVMQFKKKPKKGLNNFVPARLVKNKNQFPKIRANVNILRTLPVDLLYISYIFHPPAEYRNCKMPVQKFD